MKKIILLVSFIALCSTSCSKKKKAVPLEKKVAETLEIQPSATLISETEFFSDVVNSIEALNQIELGTKVITKIENFFFELHGRSQDSVFGCLGQIDKEVDVIAIDLENNTYDYDTTISFTPYKEGNPEDCADFNLNNKDIASNEQILKVDKDGSPDFRTITHSEEKVVKYFAKLLTPSKKEFKIDKKSGLYHIDVLDLPEHSEYTFKINLKNHLYFTLSERTWTSTTMNGEEVLTKLKKSVIRPSDSDE